MIKKNERARPRSIVAAFLAALLVPALLAAQESTQPTGPAGRGWRGPDRWPALA